MRVALSRVAALVVLMLMGAACGDDALDTVRVCGDLVVPDDLVALRVTVSSVVGTASRDGASVADGALVERTGGAFVLSDGASDARQLPVDVAVAAVAGTRVFRVQALDLDDAEVGRAEVLVSGSPERVVVNLWRDCLGFTCPLGQTCDDGACVVTPDARDVSCGRGGGGGAGGGAP